jgi:RNA polymerase sigma factor (sigma-70 family)
VNAPDRSLPEVLPADDVGRSPSLGELYERYVGRAVTLAAVLTGDRYLAEDLAHDCFVRVAARVGRLGGDQRFEAYLQRSVVNACRSRFRRLALERTFLARERVATVAEPSLPLDEDLMRALRALPYRQRAAIALRYLDDLTEEQTGRILRCSPRAVNALVSRGLATLRSTLEQEAS